MNEEFRTEQIERYLQGAMTATEATAFEGEMTTDAALQADVERHRKANVVLSRMNAIELKSRLQSIDAEIDTHKKAIITPMYRRIAIAASIIAIIGIGALMITQPIAMDTSLADLTPSEVANEYFAPTQTDMQRSETKNLKTYQDSLENADESFLSGKYYDAIAMYKVLSTRDHVLSDRAQWNLALSYLAQNDVKSFDIILADISSDASHTYFDKANELKKGLSGQ